MVKAWEKYRQLVFKNILGDHHNKDVTYWRNRMFAISLIYLLPLFLITVATGIYWAIKNNIPIIVWLDIALTIIFVCITTAPGIPVTIRKKTLIISSYIMTVVLIYLVGLGGPGLIYMYAGCIFGVFFFQNKYAFLFASINTALCVIIGVLMMFDIKPKDIDLMGGLPEWIILSSNIIFLSFLSAALIPGLFKGLQQTLSEHVALSKELEEKQESLSNAYKTIVDIEEQERQRLAGELHDGISQNLVALKMIFSGLERKVTDEQSQRQAKMFYEMLTSTIDECREIVHKVRPKELVNHGLDVSLTMLANRMNALGKTQFTVHINDSIDQHFDYADRFQIYRVIQENINNTLKYAEAAEATIVSETDETTLYLNYTDNGKGLKDIDLNAPGSFISIKRRITVLHGTVAISSQAEKGTAFRYEIPFPERDDKAKYS